MGRSRPGRRLTDQRSLIDFKVARDVQHFGADDPATPISEQMAFVVVTDRSVYDSGSDAGSFVNIGIAANAHGTHVAGIAAGSRLFGGAMSGAAPGATVFAPHESTPAAAHRVSVSGNVGRNETQHVLVRVPAGASALRVDLTGGGAGGAGQVRFMRFTPQSVPLDPTGSLTCYVPDAGGGCPPGAAESRTAVNPRPGVWELVVEARRTSSVALAPYTLSASVLGVEIEPDPDVVPACPSARRSRAPTRSRTGSAPSPGAWSAAGRCRAPRPDGRRSPTRARRRST